MKNKSLNTLFILIYVVAFLALLFWVGACTSPFGPMMAFCLPTNALIGQAIATLLLLGIFWGLPSYVLFSFWKAKWKIARANAGFADADE